MGEGEREREFVAAFDSLEQVNHGYGPTSAPRRSFSSPTMINCCTLTTPPFPLLTNIVVTKNRDAPFGVVASEMLSSGP